MHVQRRVGSIMAHDGDAVHGVTQLIKGIRYRLLGGRTANTLQLHKHAANCTAMRPTLFFPPLVHLTRALPPARYGLYALRGRSLEPSFPHLLHKKDGGDGARSNGQQVCRGCDWKWCCCCHCDYLRVMAACRLDLRVIDTASCGFWAPSRGPLCSQSKCIKIERRNAAATVYRLDLEMKRCFVILNFTERFCLWRHTTGGKQQG